jgi:ribosomal protein S18 acetylase RimI-like enzyme
MKVTFRRGCCSDLDNVYNLHLKCFSPTDCWYKSSIRSYLEKSILIEIEETKQLIGLLLQGVMTPCNKKFNIDDNNINNNKSDYKEDIFEPINADGEFFYKNNLQYKPIFGITMICVDSNYRGNGLAKKLIEKHFKDNSNKLVCLNTRKSNINAYRLYQTMGYNHIAFIKNKYFLPTEDSSFMIKDLTKNYE